MLGLAAATDPAWLEVAEADLPRMLRDHAQCELKAAQSALSVLGRFAEEAPELVAPVTALAQEETRHFAQVSDRLAERGMRLSGPESDDYVTSLSKRARSSRPAGAPLLLDRLLVAALIEARSCERFQLLSEGLQDASLRAFYRELMASEAGHYALFLRLAQTRYGEQETRTRLRTLAVSEAEIIKRRPMSAVVHG